MYPLTLLGAVCGAQVKCDELAASLATGLPGGGSLASDDEVEHACAFAAQCLDRLSERERELPQLVRVLALLRCGIGVHHSGVRANAGAQSPCPHCRHR